MSWYIVRKKGEKRWIAYPFNKEPKLKRGYELKGPFPSVMKAWMEASRLKNLEK